MSFIALLVLLLVLGVILFFARPYLDPRILTLVVVLTALGVIFWLLNATGLWSGGFRLDG